jgi:hypothetical protein
MPMTDTELATYLGIANEPKRDTLIAGLSPAKRALFDRMKEVEIEAALWVEGLGPKPAGVLIDTVRSTKRRRAWR